MLWYHPAVDKHSQGSPIHASCASTQSSCLSDRYITTSSSSSSSSSRYPHSAYTLEVVPDTEVDEEDEDLVPKGYVSAFNFYVRNERQNAMIGNPQLNVSNLICCVVSIHNMCIVCIGK